jgi:hypothetical protein
VKRRKLPLVLPPMRCDKGCGECCGVVPVTAREQRAVRAYVETHKLTPLWQGSTCPFYQRGTCAVYPVRPRVCQAFGHTWKMECPRSYNENVDDAALRKWLLSDGPPVSTLHQSFGVPLPQGMPEAAAKLPFRWQGGVS